MGEHCNRLRALQHTQSKPPAARSQHVSAAQARAAQVAALRVICYRFRDRRVLEPLFEHLPELMGQAGLVAQVNITYT